MSSLRESSTEERKLDLHTYTPSKADESETIKRGTPEKIAVNFVALPEATRQLFIDVMMLTHLRNGKRGCFKLPDPLSRRRVLLDENLFARMVVLVDAVSDLMCALNVGTPQYVGLQLTPQSQSNQDMAHYDISVCAPATDSETAEKDQAREKGLYDVESTVRRVCDLSPLAPPLVEQLREHNRCYRDRPEE